MSEDPREKKIDSQAQPHKVFNPCMVKQTNMVCHFTVFPTNNGGGKELTCL
jgi:hypothetical protein